jgi:hypothetical protein
MGKHRPLAGEAFGIWRGTSERERRVLRRQREVPRKRKPHKRRCSYCGARAVAQGLCQLHYGRERRRRESVYLAALPTPPSATGDEADQQVDSHQLQ